MSFPSLLKGKWARKLVKIGLPLNPVDISCGRQQVTVCLDISEQY